MKASSLKKGRRFRPQVEWLEVRATPAMIPFFFPHSCGLNWGALFVLEDGMSASDVATLTTIAGDILLDGVQILGGPTWLNTCQVFVFSGAGADYIDLSGLFHFGTNWVFGEVDDDVIIGSDLMNDNLLAGGDGNDFVWGMNGDDTMQGGAGHDYLGAFFINPTYYDDAGNDLMNGELGNDTLWGGSGNDTLYGEDGNDTVDGGAGDDYVDGASSSSYVGGTANLLIGGDGNDTVIGTTGNDTLRGDAGNDYLYGHDNDDLMDGGAGNDSMYGGAGNDSMYGGAGNDTLVGNRGRDTLFGDDGDDYLDGSQDGSMDMLTGGLGADNFRIFPVIEDSVTDFDGSQGDMFS